MIPDIKNMAKYTVTGTMTDSLPLYGDATTEVYLGFARIDLHHPYRRNRINALSNAKRGLHLQVDAHGDALGLGKLPKNERRHFPQKLNFLSRCGLVAPRILQRLNRLRNAVEHDYVIPEIQDVQDFVDVVELFIKSSAPCRVSFPHQTHFGLKQQIKTQALPKSLAVRLLPSKAELRFLGFHSGKRDSLKIMVPTDDKGASVWDTAEAISISSGSAYYDWVSLLISKI
jgi:hypothetical protein